MPFGVATGTGSAFVVLRDQGVQGAGCWAQGRVSAEVLGGGHGMYIWRIVTLLLLALVVSILWF